MAISSFQLGHRYRIMGSDLNSLSSFDLPCKNLKICWSNKTVAYINDYVEFNKGTYINIYENMGLQNMILMGDIDSDLDIEYVEFVFDYKANSDVKVATANLKAITNEITDNSLVFVWAENTTDNSLSRWVGLPCPSDYSGSASTLVDSARNSDGQVVGSVIRSDVAKIELKWNYLTLAQFRDIAQLFETKYGGSFFVACSFFDVVKGDFDGNHLIAPTAPSGNNPCRVFYPNDRKVSFAHIKLDSNNKPIGYTNVSLNLIDTGLMYKENEA